MLCGADSPQRSDVKAALALCPWTLGGLPTPQTAAGPGLSGADAGPDARPGRAQDGATGPPLRFVSECWEACGHYRKRQGRACAVPIRRAGPLLSVLLQGRAASREGQPSGRSDERADPASHCALLVQWTLGGLWTQQRAGGPLLCGADPTGSPTAFYASAGPDAKPGRTAQDGATKGPPSRFVSGRWEAYGHNRERQGRACPVPIRRAVPLLSVLLPVPIRRAGPLAAAEPAKPGRTAQDGATKGPPWRFVSGRWEAADTTGQRQRPGLSGADTGGQSHCFLCCCRAGRQAGKDSPGRSDESAVLALSQ